MLRIEGDLMSEQIDKIRRENSLADLARRFGVELHRDGEEWVACCPFHNERTASFSIFSGRDAVERFHCFGCGVRGDILDFVQGIKGIGLKEAIRVMGGDLDLPNVAPKQIQVRDIYEGITPLTPPSGIPGGKKIDIYNPKRTGTPMEWGGFVPSMRFPYWTIDGKPFGYVLRRDFKGGKETPMVMWVRLPNGRECWCRYPFPKPRPLYGLKDLTNGQVTVVEGEKCRDKYKAVTGRNVVTWCGGTNGVQHTDWSPLAGRSVLIWRDFDGPGMQTGNEIAEILAAQDCQISFVGPRLEGNQS
jgi:DNA primase